MLYYNRIDLSEGICVTKTSTSKGCDIYCYWYFLDKGFKFQKYVYNECHDKLMINKLMICRNLSNITILNIDGVNYCCIINIISKSEAKNLIQNVNISEKKNIRKQKKLLKHLVILKLKNTRFSLKKF